MPLADLKDHRAVQAVRRLFAKPWVWPALLCALVSLMFLDHVLTGIKPWETKWAERAAVGKGPGFNDYVHAGLWWAAVANSIVAALLALTAPLWARRGRLTAIALSPARPVAGSTSRRRFWIVLALIVVAVALPLRLARFQHAMWGDEDHAFRDIVRGEFEPANDSGDGALTFTPYDWKRTFFYDKWTNNHYLYSLTARGCMGAWRALSGAAPHEFTEWPLRIPPLLGGLGSLLAAALLLRQIGFGRAGLFLAFILAVHPWHVRYSSEGRGYALLVCFFLLAVLFLIRALETGRWRLWLLFGAMEFLALYAWKAAVHPFLVLNLAALALILLQRRDLFGRGPLLNLRGEAFTQLARLGVSNLFAAIPFIWLFAPAVPQIQRKLATSLQSRGAMGLDWFKNIYSQLFGAMDWSNRDPSTPFHTIADSPLTWPLLYLVLPLLVALGLWIAFRRAPACALLLATPFLGACFAWIHFSLTNNLLLQYYLFYTLPFLLAFAVIALTGPDHPPRKIPWRFAPHVFVFLYLLSFSPQLYLFLTFPMQEARAATAVTRTADEGRFQIGPSKIVTAGLYRVARADDPRILDLRTPEELRAVARECDASGNTFRVTVSNLGFARAMHRDYFELLNDERYFRSLGTFYGWKDDYTILAWEYLPGSMPP